MQHILKQIHLKKYLSVILAAIMILSLTACGGTKTGDSVKNAAGGNTETLQDVNQIPEDGIITKAQFETVAGQDKQIQFTGSTEDGITYTWTFQASQIQNPQDQNLKIDFTTTGLDEVKKSADNANDALQMTMNGSGLICVPTLTVVLPESWQSDAGLLLKEQDGSLAKMSEVTITSAQEETKKDTNKEDSEEGTTKSISDTTDTTPVKGTTTLEMQITSLEGDCYIVGGITGDQNKGAAAANGAAGATNADGSTQTGTDASSAGNGTGVASDNGSDSNNSGSGSSDSNGSDTGNDVASSSGSHTCTISISCTTILNNMDNLTAGKEEFVPSNGQILAPSVVEFSEGDSVHDVLKAVCKEAGIHMESSYTPAYNSAYVEGINQLYEFDCGELSGWMFSVNGWFPNYGCSKYTVSDGDVINWVYTCDLGKDVGDNSMQ